MSEKYTLSYDVESIAKVFNVGGEILNSNTGDKMTWNEFVEKVESELTEDQKDLDIWYIDWSNGFSVNDEVNVGIDNNTNEISIS